MTRLNILETYFLSSSSSETSALYLQVDRIFLVEATVTHKGMRKPLVWDRLKFTQRFSFVNATKVDHVVVDDQKGVSEIGHF